MKLVIQRVSRASVTVDGEVVGKIGNGLALLLGIENGDTMDQALQLATKVLKIRLWPDKKDANKQWSSSVVDNDFELLVVSQFTLFATFKKPKPDFHQAMGGDEARAIYEGFVEKCRKELRPDRVATGVFGAMMSVDICNEGPVTVELVAEAASSSEASPKASSSNGKAAATTPAAKASGAAAKPAVSSYSDTLFEAALMDQPYVAGYAPSLLDAQHFDKIQAAGAPPVGQELPNLLRWYEHMASFTAVERAQWPAA